MKKLNYLVCLLCVFCLGVAFMSIPASAATNLFEENFNGYTVDANLASEVGSKFTVTVGNNAEVTVKSKSGADNMAYLKRPASSSGTSIQKNLLLVGNGYLNEYMVYEWDFMQTEITDEVRMLIMGDVYTNSTNTKEVNIVKFKTDGGKFKYDAKDNGTWTEFNKNSSYEKNNWYHFKVVTHIATATYDVYINGTKVNEAPLNQSVDGRGAVQVKLKLVCFGNNTAFYTDNIRLSSANKADIHFREMFNNYQIESDLTQSDAWDTISGSATVKEKAQGDGYALLQRTGDSDATLIKSITVPSEYATGAVVAAEWDFMQTEKSTGQAMEFFANVNSESKKITGIYTEGDNLVYSSSSENKTLVSDYKTNTWYKIKVVANTCNSTTSGNATFTIYVDGKKFEANAKQSCNDVKKANSFGLKFSTNDHAGSFCIDNPVIYTNELSLEPSLENITFGREVSGNETGINSTGIASGNINCRLNVVNLSTKAVDGTYLVALYNQNGSLVQVEKSDKTTFGVDTITPLRLQLNVSLPSDEADAAKYKIKAFLWNEDTLCPISVNRDFTNTGLVPLTLQ